jgi:hypothetical protein
VKRAWVIGLALGAGMLGLALLPRPAPQPATCAPGGVAPLDHLGRCAYGVSVTTSSDDRMRGHALFLIDGDDGDARRVWAASLRDPRPAIALAFPEPRDVSGIALHRALARGERAKDGGSGLDLALRGLTREGWKLLGTLQDDERATPRLRFAAVEVGALELVLADRAGRPIAVAELEVLGALGALGGGR